ncbi:hypothetical protein B1C78_05710 [Thioalkalivibrio denitrificans]|uniref:DUF945 domain-containing protein n=1 Tax=Thioalkalivibrio denitrificans TaxID=108003 RepID=A0A1V3NLU2_9GAMM|nr:DUF945 family protein [Thioalkalivibrio denitrificans]OOG25964.1 hypothetical protein B1C78_05710 [Thioalkalivibrio denitrificans]
MNGRRLLLVLILLVAVAVPAWPAWLGWQADRQLSAYEGGRAGEMTLAHRLESFDRGWMESTALSRVRLSTGAEAVEFDVRHRISHGFGAVVVESIPLIPPELEALLAEAFGEAAPLTVTTRLGARGDSADIGLHSPSFVMTLPDDPDLRVRSAGLEGEFRVEGHRLRGQLNVPELVLEDPESTLVVTGQVLELDLSDPSSRVADGWLEYRLDALDLADGDTEPVRMERVRVRSVQTRQGDFVDLSLQSGFGAMQAAGWEATQGEMHLRLGPLHAARYEALLLELERLQARTEEGFPDRGPGAVLLEHLPGLLAHSPELRLDPLRAQMSRGTVELALGAGFDGRDMEPDTLDLVERLRLSGRIQATRALAEELAGLISLQTMGGEAGANVDPEARRLLAMPLGRGVLKGLAEEGYVREEGDGYRTDLSIEEGRLLINGEDRSEWLLLLLTGLFIPGGFN